MMIYSILCVLTAAGSCFAYPFHRAGRPLHHGMTLGSAPLYVHMPKDDKGCPSLRRRTPVREQEA